MATTQRKTKKWLPLALLLALLALTACGQGQPAQQSGEQSEGSSQQEPQFITIATGGTAGVYYQLGGTLAKLIEEQLGYKTSVQATGASVENINLLMNNQAEIAFSISDSATQAYEGTGPFEGQAPMTDLRAMAAIYPNVIQLVTTEDTGIKTFEDLKGKRVSVGDRNSGTEINARMIFEAHGMTYDDVKVDYLSFGESIDQIKNGMIDAAVISSGLPNSAIMDLAVTHKVRLIPISESALNYLQEKYPFFMPLTIPADMYDTAEDTQTVKVANVLLVNHRLSEDVVYNLTKAIFDNLEALYSAHNAALDIKLETVTEGLLVPLHPGAEKYFKEVGAIP